jgi:hypothetical protein
MYMSIADYIFAKIFCHPVRKQTLSFSTLIVTIHNNGVYTVMGGNGQTN